jgi:hypothetical protein
VTKDLGPRDWLSGGRYWDELPPTSSSAPPLRPPIQAASFAQPAPRRRGSWVWGIVAILIGVVCLYAMWAASTAPGIVPPALGIVGGVLVVVLGLVAWRRRPHQGRAWSVLLPMLALSAGVVSVFAGATIANVQGIPAFQFAQPDPQPPVAAAPAASAAPETTRAPTPATAAITETPEPAPAPVAAPPRLPATQMTLTQTLGTLQFVLKQTRSPDGLQSPTLGVTSDGRVFDPFSAAPNQVLVVLPADTTLHYTATVDRLNYAVTLSSNVDPGLVARYDTLSGTVQAG